MTQVDFYVLGAQSQIEQLQFACRLVEKAQSKQQQVLIQTASLEMAQELDNLLWTYPATGFIPHSLAGQSAPSCSVNILWQGEPSHHDIMINLSTEIPPFFSHFQRYIGIVVQNDEVLHTTRRHYKFLKDRGYQIKTHDMRLL